MSSVIDKAVEWAIETANDNSHGYSQANRNGPDYDCSSMVITAYRNAGLNLSGASYTGNMYSAFISEGFTDVTGLVTLSTGSGLIKGDVLLNTASHTCLYIGDGKVVNARTDVDGVQGDSTGQEIRIQSYWNFPWNYILRYTKGGTSVQVATSGTVSASVASAIQYIPTNAKGVGIAAIQGMLKYLGYGLGSYGVDGDAGSQISYTNNALRLAIAAGKIKKETVDYLLKLQ